MSDNISKLYEKILQEQKKPWDEWGYERKPKKRISLEIVGKVLFIVLVLLLLAWFAYISFTAQKTVFKASEKKQLEMALPQMFQCYGLYWDTYPPHKTQRWINSQYYVQVYKKGYLLFSPSTVEYIQAGRYSNFLKKGLMAFYDSFGLTAYTSLFLNRDFLPFDAEYGIYLPQALDLKEVRFFKRGQFKGQLETIQLEAADFKETLYSANQQNFAARARVDSGLPDRCASLK